MKKLEGTYGFGKEEEEVLNFWEKEQIFNKLREKNKDGKKYRFIDGPMTANNEMKIHHIWGRTLKDVFLRYKGMNGYTSHYRNGFDGQGLWVEVEVEKELGFETKKDIEDYGLDKFTKKCVERVEKYSKIITEQSIRIGQWMDWDNSYYTHKDENITGIWAFLKKCHENGWIKKSYRPSPWCPRCGTSLSEHEMTGSYKDVEHTAVFVKLPLIDDDTNILVWTTTPWTLSSNVALAVHPDFDYVKVKFEKDDKPIILAKSVYEKRFKEKPSKVLEEFKGSTLENKKYETCFPELPALKDVEHKIVLWEEVTSEDGSGVVHIAPGCGVEDFELGATKNLPVIIPIDENGMFYNNFGFFSGKDATKVKEEVFEELEKRNKLYFTHQIKHSYPICWRCKEEILFRASTGWAIAVDELRPKLIENAKKVKWNPEYQGKRMVDWLENMSDWNISRTRYYGLPLPFYNCECGHLTVVGSKEELRELATDKEKVDNLPELHRPWIDEIKIVCPKCGREVARTPEVGDVWLDAGIVPFSTLKYFTDKEYWKEYFPAEYVIEMKEQVRLWFYSLLFMSTVLEGVPPYEQVGTYGAVVSEDGSKFSKTGFSIGFQEAMEKMGADVARYSYASTSPQNDIRFGFSVADEVKRKVLSLWNMAVFFETYASIDKPEIENLDINLDECDITDKWLIENTDNFIEVAKEAYENYDTIRITNYFEKYVDEVSNFYIRVNRRRFWKSENDNDKLVAYKVLFSSIKTTLQLMAPIIPFLSEYIWQNLILKYGNNTELSVHLSNWPNNSGLKIDKALLEETQIARDITTIGLRLRNESKIKVRQPLSRLLVVDSKNIKNVINDLGEIIKRELNVKNVEIINNTDELEDKYLTLNFKEAGMIFKQDVNKVKESLESLSKEETERVVKELEKDNKVNVNNYELDNSLLIINSKPKGEVVLATENNLTVGLMKELSNELINEGIVREFVSKIQQLRKSSGFEVTDRINIYYSSNEEVKNAICNAKDYISKEALADNISVSNAEELFDINGHEVKIKVEKI